MLIYSYFLPQTFKDKVKTKDTVHAGELGPHGKLGPRQQLAQ